MKIAILKQMVIFCCFKLIHVASAITQEAGKEEGVVAPFRGIHFLIEKNDYNSAGQKIRDVLISDDGSRLSHHEYHYFQGERSSMEDPRGFTTFFTYDAWQHPLTIISKGALLPEQNQITTYAYNPEGQLASIAQGYEDPMTGPSTLVTKAYDSYGQLISETTFLEKVAISSWKQDWDQAGRRISLNWVLDEEGKGAHYCFEYNAVGLPILIKNASGSFTYAYDDQQLLIDQSTPFGHTTFSHDCCGHTTEIKKENLLGKPLFVEKMTWRSDHKIETYSFFNKSLSLPSEHRRYSYDAQGRLKEEPYYLSSAAFPNILSVGPHRATYYFDNDSILENNGSVGLRTAQMVNNNVGSFITCHNSLGEVTSDLYISDNERHYCWNNEYDALGAMIKHTLNNLLYQELYWDSFNRLVRVEQHNERQEGYTWNTLYDGLGRRIQTSYSDRNQKVGTIPLLIHYYYDPEVEFLEIGRDYFGRQWKLYGLDKSGSYGGAQGIGGLESLFIEKSGHIQGEMNNFFGDSIATITEEGVYPWGNALGAYGAHWGSSVNADLVPQWRGHYLDWTGFYYMGTRYYDPKSGRFISSLKEGSEYTFCKGDPLNEFDPDGRNKSFISLGHHSIN